MLDEMCDISIHSCFRLYYKKLDFGLLKYESKIE
jgi:hypothetical protein